MALNQKNTSNPTASTQNTSTPAMNTTQTTTSSTTNARNRTGFFDLPPEIRNVIYHLALHNFMDVILVRKETRWGGRSLKIQGIPEKDFWMYGLNKQKYKRLFELVPRLLQTCRQINEEATPILYGSNHFTFHSDTSAKDLTAFVNKIGKSCRLIRHMEFWPGRFNKADCQQALSRLKYATGLQKLTLSLDIWDSIEDFVAALRVLMQTLHKSRFVAGRTQSVVEILDFSRYTQEDTAYAARQGQRAEAIKKVLQKLLK